MPQFGLQHCNVNVSVRHGTARPISLHMHMLCSLGMHMPVRHDSASLITVQISMEMAAGWSWGACMPSWATRLRL